MTQPTCVSLFDVWPDLRPARPGDPIRVVGNLGLHRSGITHLPEGLSVEGDLDLDHTPITHLPDGLSVGRRLDIRHTALRQLPDGLSVGQHLDAYGAPLQQLPKGLSVGGYLDIRNTHITELPEGLSVGKHLCMQDLAIAHLPHDMSVLGRIFPPYALVDLQRFQATLTEPLQLPGIGAGDSAHVTAALHRRLAPYPDVHRVWMSLPPDEHWVIKPLLHRK